MSISTATKTPWWSPVTTNKINGPLWKNVVLRHQFIIILPLHEYSRGVQRGSQSAKNKKKLETSSVLTFQKFQISMLR